MIDAIPVILEETVIGSHPHRILAVHVDGTGIDTATVEAGDADGFQRIVYPALQPQAVSRARHRDPDSAVFAERDVMNTFLSGIRLKRFRCVGFE